LRIIKTTFLLLICSNVSAQYKPNRTDTIFEKPSIYFVIPSNYIISKQGYVCRQEWKMEKKTGVPVRFRLGSLDYVNRMEGK